jgi:hypothetical protein
MKDIQQRQMLISPLQNGFLLEVILVLPTVTRNMVNHRSILATIGTPPGGLYESARSLFPYAVPYDSTGAKDFVSRW